MKIGREHASVAVYAKEICLKMLHFKTNAERFSLHRIQKKGSLSTSSFRVPSGILPLRSSDFVDYEPFWVLTPLNTKKRPNESVFFRVPSGIRTHDIQNHNLTL